MYETIALLGSTGSIGKQTLDVARSLKIKVDALSANSNIQLLEQQAREFKPAAVCVADEEKAKALKLNLKDTDIRVLAGSDGMCELAEQNSAQAVVNAVVGIAGLKPTLAAIKVKKDIALANKETLVTGGSIVTRLVKENDVRLLPVDSEHSAIFQCLQSCERKEVKKLILTASGGPFFGKTKEQLKDITVEQALNHPNWSMGAKITIDSATMMNKGFEIIEAAWLFDVAIENIEVLVHKESVIHSMIELADNAILAQLGSADMHIPIQYALTYPKRYTSAARSLDFSQLCSLSFAKPDYNTFEALKICKEAFLSGGIMPTVVNGANEQAVSLFLKGRIPFLKITELVKAAAESIENKHNITIEDIFSADKAARELVLENI